MPKRAIFPLSIRTQLILAVMASTAVASLVAGGLSIKREIGSYGETKRVEARATAGLFAAMSAEAIRQRDQDRIYDSLRAMSSMPSVLHVRFSDLNGETLAEHGFGAELVRPGQAGTAEGDVSLSSLASGHPVAIAEPVILGGERVGTVALLVSTEDLRQRLASLVASAGLATLLALGLGVLAAHGFRRGVSTRIGSVASAMEMVRRTHRYEMALPNERQDELGVLVEGFNDMMREIRRRDRKLAEHRDNLEREVDDRTRDLQVAKRAADDANAAKSQFLATMSHEIRTPLNGLLVMAELMAAADLASREKRYADVIVRTGGTLLAIINDVLDLSKIEAGKIEVESIPVDLADMIDDVCQLFAAKATAQALDLAAYVAPDLGQVMGDPVRIAQIVGNLVNNAIKFTTAGHVLVEAIADPVRPGHIRISVTDTGIGIPADKLASVFESFSQADQSTTRKFGGTGLGLNICRRLVDIMGGEIGVDSVVGEGSTFWFSIPLQMIPHGDAPKLPSFMVSGLAPATARVLAQYAAASDDVSQPIMIADCQTWSGSSACGPGAKLVLLSPMGDGRAESLVAQGQAWATLSWPVRRRDLEDVLKRVASGQESAAASAVQAPTNARYSQARVLLADDNVVNREVAAEALKRFGITPETAENGAEAHAMALAGGYDLILMDGSMPIMDGFAASRAIRADEARLGHERQPIVALTAYAVGEGAEDWRGADMDGLLLKPFKLTQLADCLERFLVRDPDSISDNPATTDAASMEDPVVDAASNELLDPETMSMLEQLAGAELEPVQKIVGLFIEHAPPALVRLLDEIEKGEGGSVASAAHALKSMALSVGGRSMAADLAVIERSARQETASLSGVDPETLQQTLAATIEALNNLPWMRTQEDAGQPLPAPESQPRHGRGAEVQVAVAV